MEEVEKKHKDAAMELDSKLKVPYVPFVCARPSPVLIERVFGPGAVRTGY